MKNITLYIALILFLSCSNNQTKQSSKDNQVVNDTIFVYDTIIVYDTVQLETFNLRSEFYDKSINITKEELEKMYNYVKSNTPCKNYGDSYYINPYEIAEAILHDEQIIKEASVLFFLKVYKGNLEGKGYGYDIRCASLSNDNILLLAIQYCIISKTDIGGPLYTPMVYEWVKNKSEYTKNPDIKSVLNEIETLLKNGAVPKEHE